MVARSVVIVLAIVVAAIAAIAGFVGGYAYKASTVKSSPAGTTSAANATLSILGAGTLNSAFPQLARALVNETPGIQAPTATQTYEGSLDVTTAVTSLHTPADVVAVADFRLIPQLLQPSYANHEIVFGSTPEVLCYNPSVAAFDGINATNWADELVNAVASPGAAPFGVWNASTDPNGYNEIFSLQLQGLRYHADPNYYFAHFYQGPSGTPAAPIPSVAHLEKESQAALLLAQGTVSAVITYRAYAVVNHLHFVAFDPVVGLAANDSAALAEYAPLSTYITTSGGTAKVVPAPVLFAVTVPLDAPNPALGAAFIHLLLSPQGSAILSEGGAFTPIYPGWADHPSNVPSILAPDVTSLPSWASGFLA